MWIVSTEQSANENNLRIRRRGGVKDLCNHITIDENTQYIAVIYNLQIIYFQVFNLQNDVYVYYHTFSLQITQVAESIPILYKYSLMYLLII